MTPGPSLDTLWDSSPRGVATLEPDRLARLPEPVRRYLTHAIAPGTRLASAVRLRMHGEIKLGRWLEFTAEQVICRDGRMLWTATVRALGIAIFRGYDQFIDEHGEMRWTLLGLVPVVTGTGPDVTRSAAGRVQAESIWLPSMLCGDDVAWTSRDARHATAPLKVGEDRSPVDLSLGADGRVERVKVLRWGNADGGAFGLVDFGGIVDAEATYGGYTIPSRVRVGWHIGTPRFDSDGEFFRATIDDAVFR